MFFADTSSDGITALQKAFSLERAVAEKLVADVPVMVKRAATPEVADALLDLLNSLGAQVVLLPSTATPSVVPADSAGNLLTSGGPIWGNLDLPAADPRTPVISTTAPPAASARAAASLPASPLPLPKPALPAPVPIPIAQSSLPPPAAAIPTPIAVAPRVADREPDPDRFALDAGAAPLELAHLQAKPRVYSNALRQRIEASEAPPAQSDPLELNLEEDISARESARPTADLGLGSVPPLPSVGTSRAPAARPSPPRVPAPKASISPAASRIANKSSQGRSSQAPRAMRTGVMGSEHPDASAVLPDLQLAVPGAGDAYWSAKRKTAQGNQGNNPGNKDASSLGSVPRPSTGPNAERDVRARKPSGSLVPPPGSRGFALLSLLLGSLLLGVSAYYDQSVFSGNATPLWILLQGLAFFLVGLGLVGVRR